MRQTSSLQQGIMRVTQSAMSMEEIESVCGHFLSARQSDLSVMPDVACFFSHKESDRDRISPPSHPPLVQHTKPVQGTRERGRKSGATALDAGANAGGGKIAERPGEREANCRGGEREERSGGTEMRERGRRLPPPFPLHSVLSCSLLRPFPFTFSSLSSS